MLNTQCPGVNAHCSMTNLEADLALAHALANSAASISLSFFRRELKSRKKADGSLVTEADEAVEDELRRILARERPADAILGEERGESGSSSRRWIIDAIDGTVSFAASDPDWGTLIALEVENEVVMGVCDLPVHGRRYWATRGGGAFLRSRDSDEPLRLRVSAQQELRLARTFLSPQSLPNEKSARIHEVLSRSVVPLPHQNHPAIQVAEGGYELAVFFTGGPWDIAAPAIVVEEAGGRFSDLSGGRSLRTGAALFSNGKIHDAALKIVREV